MSRLKNFARGVVSGYVQMAANIVFTLASVPLALHYLSKEEFALWALVTQIAGCFALIDFGMAASVARILADHKDDRDGGRYGGVLKAGAVVFSVQGAAIAGATLLLGPSIGFAFGIAPALQTEFVFLLQGYGFLLAFAFATKVLALPFWGFQRYDVGSYCATAGFALQLGVLWFGFSAGWGVRSMLIAYAATTILNGIWSLVAGLKLEVYPRRGTWGKIEVTVLRELFAYGRDVFLMSIGSQMLSASQIIIITQTLGLDAAATWAICSKLFTLAQQAVSKIFESSAAAFAEMYIRGEQHRLLNRFRDIVVLTASLSVAVALGGVGLNASFVAVWTHGRVSWPIPVDAWMALFLVVWTTSRCHTGMSGVFKDLRTMRFIYFAEGLTFITSAWFAAKYTNFAGIAATSVAAMVIWSGRYGWQLNRRFWKLSNLEMSTWLAPAARVFIALSIFWALAVFLTFSCTPIKKLTVLAVSGTLVSAPIVWLLGLPKSIKDELSARVTKLLPSMASRSR